MIKLPIHSSTSSGSSGGPVAASHDNWRIEMKCAFPGPTATRCFCYSSVHELSHAHYSASVSSLTLTLQVGFDVLCCVVRVIVEVHLHAKINKTRGPLLESIVLDTVTVSRAP